MDVVKLPKKVRMVCYEIMDGKEEALDTLESFADKYPHQVAAVKAEVAYFNLDYEKALALDLAILPWLEEWYYSNVSDEHMIAMTVAAIQLHREQELIEALTKEQTRIRAENGLPQRDRFCDILMDYLKRGLMPFADNDMDDEILTAQLKALMDEKQTVQEKLQAMEQEAVQSESRMSRMAELREWMAHLEVNTEYHDEQVRMAVEQITVVDAETIHIKFRYPGLEMDRKLI